MSERSPSLAEQALALFDKDLDEKVPALVTMHDYSEDDVLGLTRKIRLRQLALDLNENQGKLSDDPEERKVQLAMMKDLDNQVLKIKTIGAKEKIAQADYEAAEATQRFLKMMGDDLMRRDPNPAAGESRAAPSIADATGLPPLVIRPDETQVGLDTTTFEELMERTGNAGVTHFEALGDDEDA